MKGRHKENHLFWGEVPVILTHTQMVGVWGPVPFFWVGLKGTESKAKGNEIPLVGLPNLASHFLFYQCVVGLFGVKIILNMVCISKHFGGCCPIELVLYLSILQQQTSSFAFCFSVQTTPQLLLSQPF